MRPKKQSYKIFWFDIYLYPRLTSIFEHLTKGLDSKLGTTTLKLSMLLEDNS